MNIIEIYTGIVKSRDAIDTSSFKYNMATLSFIENVQKTSSICLKKEAKSKHLITTDNVIARTRFPFLSVFIEDKIKDTIFDSLLLKIEYDKEIVNGEYLSFIINSDKFQEILLKASTTPKKEGGITTIKAENFKKILNYIKFPSLEIQEENIKKIKEIEILIEKKKKKIENVFNEDLMCFNNAELDIILSQKNHNKRLELENKSLREKIKELESKIKEKENK